MNHFHNNPYGLLSALTNYMNALGSYCSINGKVETIRTLKNAYFFDLHELHALVQSTEINPPFPPMTNGNSGIVYGLDEQDEPQGYIVINEGYGGCQFYELSMGVIALLSQLANRVDASEAQSQPDKLQLMFARGQNPYAYEHMSELLAQAKSLMNTTALGARQFSTSYKAEGDSLVYRTTLVEGSLSLTHYIEVVPQKDVSLLQVEQMVQRRHQVDVSAMDYIVRNHRMIQLTERMGLDDGQSTRLIPVPRHMAQLGAVCHAFDSGASFGVPFNGGLGTYHQPMPYQGPFLRPGAQLQQFGHAQRTQPGAVLQPFASNVEAMRERLMSRHDDQKIEDIAQGGVADMGLSPTQEFLDLPASLSSQQDKPTL